MNHQQSRKAIKPKNNLSSSEIDCDIFKRIVDNAHDLIYRFEVLPEHKYIYVNPASVDITGYTPEEYYADPERGIKNVHPDDQHLLQAFTTDPNIFNHPLELRLINKSGQVIWIEQWNHPFFNDEGKLYAVESISRNITERKRIEESLRESEERFRALFSNNQEIMILLSPESGQIMDANHAAVTFYGWSHAEFTKKNIADINTLSKTDIKIEMEKALLEQRNHFLFKHRRSDGTIRDVEVFTGPIQVGGETQLYSIIHDITARKINDERLKTRLLENETLKWVSTALRNAQTEEELINKLLDEILQNINVPASAIVLYDNFLGRFRPANKKGFFRDLGSVDFQKCESLFNTVMETRTEIFLTNDSAESASKCLVLHGIPADWHGVCFPFQSTQFVIGVILISAPKAREFTDVDLKLLGIIGDIGTNAIQRMRMHVTLNDSYLSLQSEMKVRREIEEMLAKEKELLSISLLSIGEGIISTETDGTITILNSAAELITGFTSAESIGKPISSIFQIIDDASQKICQNPIEYLVKFEKTNSQNPDYRLPVLLTRNNEKKLISGKITPIIIKNEESGYIIVFDDQTEIERNKSHSSLSQKMEAIGQLAAGIAHEINTPIQYVGDNVNFLNRAFLRLKETNELSLNFINEHQNKTITAEEVENLHHEIENKKTSHYFDEFPKAFQETLEGIERVRKIVMAIREFSHPSEKEKRLSDLNNGVLTTVTISRNEWKYCAELETNLDPDLPLVFCQIDEINQVLLNMIINAAQSIQERLGQNSDEKGRIEISTMQNDGNAIITIKDTGNGIPAQFLNRVFDPFFTTKGIGRGTGQGLSIAHNIIEKKHHGMIQVESKIGIGTTFTIELPIEEPEAKYHDE